MTEAIRQPLRPAATQPLAMPDQDFHRPFRDPAAPGVRRQPFTGLRRFAVFAPSLVLCLSLATGAVSWFSLDGAISLIEIVLTVLSTFAFFWVTVSVSTAVLGLFWRPRARAKGPLSGLHVAVLLPMYGEPASSTISATVSLLARLHALNTPHRFSLHILSDTRDLDAVAVEQSTVAYFCAAQPHLHIRYRRRAENTDYKSGNLREWVRRAGADHEAMLVLDADSVMGAGAVIRMADAMAMDPSVGLLQSLPRLLPGGTLWQRLQEFAAQVYGVNLGRGHALWAGNEANFMGHNALLRTRAFAAAAGLPHLPGRRPLGGVILSHDFVEAALIRRAGWAVRVMPEAEASFEDTPENLLGYIRRDRRWCQGNMQHLRLLRTPGVHIVSRFYLLQGAMAYLASVWWLVLLCLWAALGDGGVIRYFADANPMIPVWPSFPPVAQGTISGLVGLMLLAPKLIGAAAFVRDNRLGAGARLPFIATFVLEMGLSVLVAPTLMVHHVRAVLRTFAGFDAGWAPHSTERPSWALLARFHATETLLGIGLLALAVAGYLTLWLLPVAVCLLLAVPLSALLAVHARDWPLYRFAALDLAAAPRALKTPVNREARV